MKIEAASITALTYIRDRFAIVRRYLMIKVLARKMLRMYPIPLPKLRRLNRPLIFLSADLDNNGRHKEQLRMIRIDINLLRLRMIFLYK